MNKEPKDIYERLRYFRYYLSLSQSELANKLGITTGAVSGIERAVNGPSFPIMSAISERFPELNMNWFISGRGEMLLNETKKLLQEKNPITESETESILQEEPHNYTATAKKQNELTDEQAKALIEEWRQKYFDILEKYNICLQNLDASLGDSQESEAS